MPTIGLQYHPIPISYLLFFFIYIINYTINWNWKVASIKRYILRSICNRYDNKRFAAYFFYLALLFYGFLSVRGTVIRPGHDEIIKVTV